MDRERNTGKNYRIHKGLEKAVNNACCLAKVHDVVGERVGREGEQKRETERKKKGRGGEKPKHMVAQERGAKGTDYLNKKCKKQRRDIHTQRP